MATKLEKPLKRELEIGGQAFIVTLAPDTLSLVGKGRRKGLEIRWDEMVSGEAALAAALQASVINPTVHLEPSARNVRPGKSKRKRSKTA
jgi:hypothetical protein